MRPVNADDFERMAKEQHAMWVPMMEADEKHKLIDAGFMLAADVLKGMPTIEVPEVDRETRQSISFAVAILCSEALFDRKMSAGDKKRIMAHVQRLTALAGIQSHASKIARALLPEAEGQCAPDGARGEIIHVYENSRLCSEHFTVDAVTAAYVEGLAALREIDALRARCEAAERDLAVERGCLSCWYMDEDCPADCDRHGSRWKWRGPDRPGDVQCAPGDAPVSEVC